MESNNYRAIMETLNQKGPFNFKESNVFMADQPFEIQGKSLVHWLNMKSETTLNAPDFTPKTEEAGDLDCQSNLNLN